MIFDRLENLERYADVHPRFAATIPFLKRLIVENAENGRHNMPDCDVEVSARFEVAKHSVVEGGEERFHSVRNGIEALSYAVDLIAVQDGVRPFATPELINRTVECALKNGAAIPVVKAVDSYRAVEGEESHIIDRSPLRIVQTPQIFAAPILRAAYDTPFRKEFTDDASVVEYSGEKIALCDGEYFNIKITTPADLIIAEAIATELKASKTEM